MIKIKLINVISSLITFLKPSILRSFQDLIYRCSNIFLNSIPTTTDDFFTYRYFTKTLKLGQEE